MTETTTTQERILRPTNGWLILIVWFALALGSVLLWRQVAETESAALGVTNVLLDIALVIGLAGFYIVNPNMSRVLVLFGRYVGSVREAGFFYTNPFTVKKHISLRVHNFDGSTLKVNDLLGNPIEISAVVVWRVQDTARASFDVEDYEHFVRVQSESALRGLATTHPYDDLNAEDAETTLRGSTEEVAAELQTQLGHRLGRAGIEVLEARLNHLAYAQEIASAMLQRQQASAIIAARRLIVEGAVGMVQMALEHMKDDGILELDEERKATLVGNLLVVLCGQASVQPIVNTGSLYN